ncbi:MAG: hypothetical protein EZS26_002069 [Candidatus Ordinivivax streblomastigis]|uniref:Uncharacterized protein n=1 Tax=Candidatus Ordinivivax streblomastigis TaxID=2540710 RepID=A0A5M8P067_9BACT|nr:MAG: hypothetical protein EZS26_002069 [Candidatus Ordinivivax streblomastigis]
MQKWAQLFVANGYGFGKYWTGYVFGKTPKAPHFFYLTENRMAILSAGIDEDGERSIVVASDEFTPAELSVYFRLDYSKTSAIQWFQPINVLLLCQKKESVRESFIYYTWPALKLNFVAELSENTIVVHDRFTDKDTLEGLKKEATSRKIDDKVEFWSMVKLLTMGDRFGELAPKICMESIPELKTVRKTT